MKSIRASERRARPRPEIEGLSAYRVRQAAEVKLNQNESPVDWPPELKAEVLRRLAARPWNRYPPVDAEALREGLARYCGVTPGMIAAANGSNEAILALIQSYAGGKTVVLTAPGYSMSRPLALVGGADVLTVHLRPDFTLDAGAMLDAALQSDAAMVMLASPNNPTGNAFGRPEIEHILQAAPGLVVIDEAYANFARDSFVGDLPRCPNLVILRTFSKAFALAGARLGWIVANEDVVSVVRKALPPYNLNVFAQEVALAALERLDLVLERVDLIVRERTRVSAALQDISGVRPYPSEANFILFWTQAPAGAAFEGLLRRGVLVRDVSGMPMLDRCLRVTIGMPEDNGRFLDALRAVMGEFS